MQSEMVLLACLALLTIAALVWQALATYRRTRVVALQSDVQSKVIEKLGSSEDVLRYLQTDAGRKLFRASDDQAAPAARIIGALWAGITIIALGVAFLLVYRVQADEPSRRLWLILSVIAFPLGIGSLVAGVCAFFLSKNWGLIGHSSERT